MRDKVLIGFCAAVVLGCALAPASFAADNMAGLYGNTIKVTFPGGHVTKVYVEQGGKYTVSHDGKLASGSWTDDGKQTCYTETTPAPPAGTKPICLSSKAYAVGDTFDVPIKSDTVESGSASAANKAGHAIILAGHQ